MTYVLMCTCVVIPVEFLLSAFYYYPILRIFMLVILVRGNAHGAHLLYMRYMHKPLTVVAHAFNTAEICVRDSSMEELLERVESFVNSQSIEQRDRFVERELLSPMNTMIVEEMKIRKR